MYTTSFVYNIHCMFLTRGDGSCIPQVLFTISTACFLPEVVVHVYHKFCLQYPVYVLTRDGGSYIPQVLFIISTHVFDQRWWFMYTTSFVYNIRCMF